MKKKKAFGLIETLIACAILIIITGAVLSLNVIVSNNIFFAKQRSVAFNLAQDGIEAINQIRDTNLIDGLSATTWNTLVCNQSSTIPLSVPNKNGSSVYIQKAGQFSACYGSAARRLTLVPSTDGNGEEITIEGVTFKRKITFEPSGVDPQITDSAVTEDNALRATVTISWIQNGKQKEIELKKLFTNWKLGI